MITLIIDVVVFLASVKITPVDAHMHNYCYCVTLEVSVYLHVCMNIYTVIVLSSGLYTWGLLAMLIILSWFSNLCTGPTELKTQTLLARCIYSFIYFLQLIGIGLQGDTHWLLKS